MSNEVDQGRIEKLGRSLMKQAVRGTPPIIERYVEGILRNPQAHIEALVEAGVLAEAKSANALGFEDQGRTCYVVLQPEPPHEHDWRWFGDHVRCADRTCDQFFLPPWSERPRYEGVVPRTRNNPGHREEWT
jgi:hypothetical protein